jgi:hypothetical protein
MRQAFLETIRDLATPGVGNPHHRAMTFVGHSMISAVLVDWLGAAGFAASGIIAAAYAVLKERRDIRKGGGIWDSLEDTLAVAMGGFYGAFMWPAYVLGTAFGIMVLSRARQ